METTVKRFKNIESCSKAGAQWFVKTALRAAEEKGWCSVVLSGGRTPKALFAHLSGREFSGKIPWDLLHIFWTDERWVGVTDPESNFNMARTHLLSKVPLPDSHIHPIRTTFTRTKDGADFYEKEIRTFFISQGRHRDDRFPQFDIMLLGMGTDGHTASLFQGDCAVDERKRWVLPVKAPGGYRVTDRITMTMPVINNATHALFLLSGREKTELLETILRRKKAQTTPCPASLVHPRKELVWFVAESSSDA